MQMEKRKWKNEKIDRQNVYNIRFPEAKRIG